LPFLLLSALGCGTIPQGKTTGWGASMSKPDVGYDYHRYRNLLAEAADETKRLELIDLLMEERAKDRLAAERHSDRAAMTAATIATMLGSSSRTI
jgi:hypothetical protein